MPLRLEAPKAGRTPYYRVRGTFLGVRVDRTAGAAEKRIAQIILKRWEREIADGSYRDPNAAPEPVVERPTFRSAALAYLKAGGERKFMSPIIEMTGPHALRDKALTDIDQIALDQAAEALYPNATAQTRNRQVYTPVVAVLKRAGIEKRFERPKGWRGKKSISWLEPEQAFALFAAADTITAEFGLFLRLLCYTGMRLGEALAIKAAAVDLGRQTIYLPETKNGEARTVHLTPDLVTALANHPRGLERKTERLIRFHSGGRLRNMLKEAMAAAGLHFPRRQCGFHLFCHTYGTWMHRFGGLDNFALTRTNRWKDPRSAERYLHTEVNAEARMADRLPVARSK